MSEHNANKSRLFFGFSAIELLITLIVATVFLITGYQLFTSIIKDNGEARSETTARNTVSEYLEKYKLQTTSHCTNQVPLSDSPVEIEGLTNTTITVNIECPTVDSRSVSKITAILKYNSPQHIVSDATYVYKK